MRTAAALFVLSLASAALAQKWEPYKFKGEERYEFKISTLGEEKPVETFYTIDIRKKDEEHFDVTWSTKTAVKKEDLGERTAFGTWGAVDAAPAMIALNPLYGAFITQVDMKEGEKMSIFGAATIKVGAKETVGGVTGLCCKLFTKDEDKPQEELVCEWVINTDLALPIRSVTYEGGQAKYKMELVSYKKY